MKNQELVKVQIPKGYTAKIEGNEVRIVKVENEFRDGDFVAEKIGDCPFIYKGTDEAGFHLFYAGLDVNRVLIIGDDEARVGNGTLRAATAEEKQELEDTLTGKGLFWNAAQKRIEKKRWRAAPGKFYFHIDARFGYDIAIEGGNDEDAARYNKGNYFETAEKAAAATKVVEAVIKKFHEENC